MGLNWRIPLKSLLIGHSLLLGIARGFIVLGLPERSAAEIAGKPRMSVIVDHGGELYSLMVDQVGEVLSLAAANFERNPATDQPLFGGSIVNFGTPLNSSSCGAQPRSRDNCHNTGQLS